MGDDVYNGIYKITLPDNATLKDLINVLLKGGCGNTWPIPQMSDIGWDIYTDIGKIAFVSADKTEITYLENDCNTPLTSLGITWVYAGREGDTTDITLIKKRFE